mmetsp:Transcript_15042/g.42767  ORF Transcript_15042/g.42767 Transcript_15042/m.42767 type:complete len:225 (-) Transcript_15042:513-1187(-)
MNSERDMPLSVGSSAIRSILCDAGVHPGHGDEVGAPDQNVQISIDHCDVFHPTEDGLLEDDTVVTVLIKVLLCSLPAKLDREIFNARVLDAVIIKNRVDPGPPIGLDAQWQLPCQGYQVLIHDRFNPRHETNHVFGSPEPLQTGLIALGIRIGVGIHAPNNGPFQRAILGVRHHQYDPLPRKYSHSVIHIELIRTRWACEDHGAQELTVARLTGTSDLQECIRL